MDIKSKSIYLSSVYLQDVHYQEVVGPPHTRAPALAVHLRGATVRDLLAPRRKTLPSISRVVPGDGVHGPLGPDGNGSLRHVGPIEPEVRPISPHKSLLSHEVQGHLLETLLRQIVGLGTESVLVSSPVVGCDGPGDVDLGANIP